DRQPRSRPVARGDAALPPLPGRRRHGRGRDPRHAPGARVRRARDHARERPAARRPRRSAALRGGEPMSLGVASGRHLQALLGSLGRLLRNPLASFMTLLVIALALALPAGLKVFVSNAQAATGNFASAVDLSVFLKTDVPLAKAQQLAQAAQQRPDV